MIVNNISYIKLVFFSFLIIPFCPMIFPHLKLKNKLSTTSKEKKRCVEKQIFSFLVVIAWSFEDMAKKDALPNGLEKIAWLYKIQFFLS